MNKNNRLITFSYFTFSYIVLPSILVCSFFISEPVFADNVRFKQGKQKAALCAGCHGSNGISLTDDTPNLARQKLPYLIKQLTAFKAGTRHNATMNAMAAALTEQDIKNVSFYFSHLSVKNVEESKSLIHSTDEASSAEFPERVFYSLKGSAQVGSFADGKIASGGPNMLYTAITPNGKLLLSTSPSTASVYIFSAKTLQQLAIINVGKAPKGVKVTPDGQFAYVSNQGSNNISVVDLNSFKNVATIETPAGPHNVRFTKNGETAYVTLQGGAGIGVVDTKSRKILKVIAVPGITGPHNLDLSKDEETAFVRDFVHHVAVLDLKTEKVTKVIEVGKGHGGIDVTPNGKFAATAAIADSKISLINTKTLAVTFIEVGKGPHGIRASKNNQWLYVTLTGENKIAVINMQTMKVHKKIAVNKFPFWLAVLGNP